MSINYLENQFSMKNLFLNEEALELNYLPEAILHREQELTMLSKIFINLLEDPFKISRKVLIQGDVGIGKTVIARTFGKMMLLSAQKRYLNIKYVHINCRNEKTSYKILYSILRNIDCPVPMRGFSPQELLMMLQEFLASNQIYLFLTLDELNYLDNSNLDLIYSLTRLNDANPYGKNYLSILSIVRDITLLRNLDISTISTLQGTIITLKKYTISQISDIINQRLNIAVKPMCFSKELVKIVAESTFDSGDLRKVFNIIRNSIKIAESKDHSKIGLEDVKVAINSCIPSLQDDALSVLNLHQIYLLEAITQILGENKKNKAGILDIKEVYNQICFKDNEQPRKNTQIWQNLQILKNYDLIHINLISQNPKGRTSEISINTIPLHILEEEINQRIKNIKNFAGYEE